MVSHGEPPFQSPSNLGKPYPLVNIQKAIENGPVEILDLPINSMVIFHGFLYVYQAGYTRNLEQINEPRIGFRLMDSPLGLDVYQ